MSIKSLNRYDIKVSKIDYNCISVNGKTTNHFIIPDTKAGIQKLYVLKNGSDIYYIGVTSLSMSSRLRIGYRAKGEQGYHGYKWIGKISRAELIVWCLNEGNRSHAEAIEGELVYLVRNRTGNWPKYQMEIHFHPDASNEEKRIAELIYNDCFQKR